MFIKPTYIDRVVYGLKEQEIAAMRNVFASYPQVEAATLYGARARGDYKPYLDIDIALQGRDLSHGQIAEIESKLDDLFLPYTIDLLDIKSLTNPLLLNITNEGKKIFNHE